MTLNAWAQRGISTYNYCPVSTFSNIGDSHLHSIDTHRRLTNGRDAYYLSIGPLWYYMPYIFNNAFNNANSNQNLRIFNLLLAFISLLFVFRVSQIFFIDNQNTNTAAFITTIIYLFLPQTLWYQGNVYVHEGAVLPFLYAAFYFFISIQQNNTVIYRHWIAYAASIACATAIDWVGCVAALCMGCAALYRSRVTVFAAYRNPKKWYFTLFAISGGIAVAAVAAIAVLYSTAIDYATFKTYALFRMHDRNSFAKDGLMQVFLLRQLAFNYALAYAFPLFITTSIFGLLQYKKQDLRLTPEQKNGIFLLSSVVLVHHFIMLGHAAAHDYATLKFALPLSLTAGFLVDKLLIWHKKIGIVTVFLFITTSLFQYYIINPAGCCDTNGIKYDVFEQAGKAIAANTMPDEVLFINCQNLARPDVEYYACRNQTLIFTKQKAVEYMQTHPARKACFISAQGHTITAFDHFISNK